MPWMVQDNAMCRMTGQAHIGAPQIALSAGYVAVHSMRLFDIYHSECIVEAPQ
jgi:hypothetical protein